jgi:hypothetical protein
MTRAPVHPDDPEVVDVFPTSRQAVEWMLDVTIRLGRRAGPKLRAYDSRCHIDEGGPCSCTVKLTLDLAPGEEVRVK